MVTRRQPIQRLRHTQEFTPETIEAFKHLRKVYEKGGCACQEGAEEPHQCQHCQAYDKAEGKVVDLLQLKPWELLDNPYQRILPHQDTQSCREGRALWRRLETASGLQPLDDEEAEIVE